MGNTLTIRDDTPSFAEQFWAVSQNQPLPTTVQEANPIVEEEQEEHAVVCNDNMGLDVEGPQGPGDTYNPNRIDESTHDGHAETDLGQ